MSKDRKDRGKRIRSSLYECLACGHRQFFEEMHQTSIPFKTPFAILETLDGSQRIWDKSDGVKCYTCGYRVLKRSEPIDRKTLDKQFLNPYNRFVEHGLQDIVNKIGPVPGGITNITLGKVRAPIPPSSPDYDESLPHVVEPDGIRHEIYPEEAIYRNLTYACGVSLEMSVVLEGKKVGSEIVYIGDLPVMVKSKICPTSRITQKDIEKDFHGACDLFGPPDFIEKRPLKRDEELQRRRLTKAFNDLGGYFIILGAKRVISVSVLEELFTAAFKMQCSRILDRFGKIIRKDVIKPFRIASLVSPDILTRGIIGTLERHRWDLVESPLFQFGIDND